MPELKNVLFVDGLTANLVSVSQLTDDFEDVWFNKHRCLVLNSAGKRVMHGRRASDNCYHTSSEDMEVLPCLSIRSCEEEMELWHKKLGHMNYPYLQRLSNKGYIRELPLLKGSDPRTKFVVNAGLESKLRFLIRLSMQSLLLRS